MNRLYSKYFSFFYSVLFFQKYLIKILKNIAYGDLTGRTLMFAIYDFDRFSRHDQIGEVQVPLGQVDLGKVVQEWRDVSPPAGDSDKVIYL